MRKHDQSSAAAEGARRATGAAAERDRKGRCSARRKRATVLRLLRGEDLESVSRELGITAARASQWRDRFLAAGQAGVKSRATEALSLQRTLEVGSYQTAWAMLQRLRSVLVRPGRDRLAGTVAVDETYIGGEESGLRGGRARGKKVLTGIAVELRPRPAQPAGRPGSRGGPWRAPPRGAPSRLAGQAVAAGHPPRLGGRRALGRVPE